MSMVDSLPGRTIRWTFADGPMPGVRFEHTFDEDGSVVWRILDGPMQGGTAREKPYHAVKVAHGVHAISYRSASGHTLTVVLDLATGRMHGFASNDKEWHPMQGSFEVVRGPAPDERR